MAKAYGFDKPTSRDLIRTVYGLRQQVERLSRVVADQSSFAARAREAGVLTYAIPKTTLQPGGSCDAYLVKFDGSDPDSSVHDFIANERDTVTITDYHSWAFAVGTDDYSSTSHRLAVIQHPLSKTWVVSAPTNLIQQAKPDANISSGSSGTFSIYQDGTDTTVNVDANVTWGDNAEGVTSGKESWVHWNGAQWEWVGGDCE